MLRTKVDGLIDEIRGVVRREPSYVFFPHRKLRPNQKRGIPKIFDFLQSSDKILILKAHTGSGKESMVLTASIQAIANGVIDKAIVVVPTISAKGRDSEEIKLIIKRWRNRLPKDFLAIVLASKPQTCMFKERAGGKMGVYQLCRALVTNKECPHFEKLKKSKIHVETPICIDFNLPEDTKILADVGCLFYIQPELIERASLIVCDFNYIINPFIRKRMLSLTGKTLIVFNEAHMVAKRAMFTNTLSYSTIKKAIKEVKTYRMPKIVEAELTSVANALKKLVGKYSKSIEEDRFEKEGEGAAKISYLEFSRRLKGLKQKIKLFEKYGNKVIMKKFKTEGKSFSAISVVGEFLETVENHKKYIINGEPDGRLSKLLWVSENKATENIKFGLTNTMASIPLWDVFKKAYKMIFMSATIFKEWIVFVLGLYAFRNLIRYEEFDYVFPKKNRIDIVLARTKIMRSNLNKRVLSEVTKELKDICRRNKKPICIIVTNGVYEKLKKGLEKLKIFDIPKGVKEFNKRRIIIEKLNTEPYSTLSPYEWPSVSIDIPNVRTAVVVGVSIARYNMISRVIVSNYAKAFKGGNVKGAFHLIMTLPAILMEEQAVGRFQRSEKDKIKIYWMDKRYGDYPHSLLPYIRQYFYGISKVVAG